MKNAYFVQANDIYGNDKKSTYIPYATGCIQAYCMKNEIIQKNYHFGKIIYSRRPIEDVLAELENPFVVLFSCSVWNMEYNKVLAASEYPECNIVFGGHNISSDGSDLEKYEYVDFLTHRFGEETTEGVLVNLVNNGNFDEVPNISFRDENNQIKTTKYAPQTGTAYPSPYLEGVFDNILEDGIEFSGLFESNRGCPNSCSFCDWSSLRSKVRLFPMERVLAELDWFVEHKIEYIYCTDGNFCLFDRDAEIANYVVACKEKYGYPKVFKVFFTKNRFNFVFDVSTKFFKSGLDKAKTISFQSMNPEVLKNIGRKNISIDMFRDLMKKYNELNISTFSELILGLPGETYTSFCEGVNELIENGQHHAINIYPCELLPNSEMGQKAYQERFSIKSSIVPFKLIHSNGDEKEDGIVEYSEYITSTFSMKETEWARALLFASYVQGLHNLGLLRAVAIYCRHEKDVKYNDFYNELIDFSKNKSMTVLNKVYERISGLCDGIITGENELVATCSGLGNVFWGFDELVFLEFYKDLNAFYEEVKAFVIEKYGFGDELEAVFKYQYDIIKKITVDIVSVDSEYDFSSYYNKIYAGEYEKLRKEATHLTIKDDNSVKDFSDFAREIVWYGRNRRATDYTSTNYSVELI